MEGSAAAGGGSTGGGVSSGSEGSPGASFDGEGSGGNSPDEGEEKDGRGPKLKKTTPRVRQIKVNGGTEYVDEEAVFRNYQKYRSADLRLKEISQKEAEIDEFWQRLQSDPEYVFKSGKVPVNRRELAERWLEEELSRELTPEDPRDQELRALKEQLEKYQTQEKETREQQIERQKREFIESRKTEISTTLAEAMKATHLSSHPESAAAVLREMAVYMRAAKERGETVTPEELVEHVHRNRFTQMYTLAHQYEGDELIEFLGDEIVNRIRRADLARLKKSREIPVQSWKSDGSQQSQKSNEKFVDPNDIRFAMRSFR